jgi:regulator of sigma E protease
VSGLALGVVVTLPVAASGFGRTLSWLVTIAAIAFLVIIHEFGHFLVAKAVGMRVERLYLFFGRTPLHFRRGETEYGIGWLPLGGYAKISGMTPHEELPPEVAPRAFFRQKVWKRVVVILAGPAMNVLTAFFIFFALLLANGEAVPTNQVAVVQPGSPAAQALRPGDRVIAVDGVRGGVDTLRRQLATHRCPGVQTQGCRAATPARVTVLRDGRELTVTIYPRYDASARRTLLGFGFGSTIRSLGPLRAAGASVTTMWDITKLTGQSIAKIFEPSQRKQLSGIVGISSTAEQAFASNLSQALFIVGVVSLSLGLLNLLPFLPLDGGHVFWALAEKIRGRPIPFSIMERASVVGILLVVFLFIVGLSNDINRLNHGGFRVR